MDIDLSQLPRYVNGGPMVVYVPDPVGVPPSQPGPIDPRMAAPRKVDERDPEAARAAAAKAIRAATSPATAKRIIDAKIVQASAKNRARAERTLKALDVEFSPRSATMSGIWTWLTGSGKLADLSVYTPEQREQLKSYLKAESLDAIEKTFTQPELDAVLAKIRQGVPPPAEALPIADPYSQAVQSYRAGVVSTLAPLGSAAATTGGKVATTVGEGIVTRYQEGQEAPGRAFAWFGKAKWAIGLAVLGAGGYIAWPFLSKYVGKESAVARKLNAMRTLFGGTK